MTREYVPLPLPPPISSARGSNSGGQQESSDLWYYYLVGQFLFDPQMPPGYIDRSQALPETPPMYLPPQPTTPSPGPGDVYVPTMPGTGGDVRGNDYTTPTGVTPDYSLPSPPDPQEPRPSASLPPHSLQSPSPQTPAGAGSAIDPAVVALAKLSRRSLRRRPQSQDRLAALPSYALSAAAAAPLPGGYQEQEYARRNPPPPPESDFDRILRKVFKPKDRGLERVLERTPAPEPVSDFERMIQGKDYIPRGARPPASVAQAVPEVAVFSGVLRAGSILGGLLFPGNLSDEAPRPDDKPNPFVMPLPLPQGNQGPPEPVAKPDTGPRYDPDTFKLGPRTNPGIDAGAPLPESAPHEIRPMGRSPRPYALPSGAPVPGTSPLGTLARRIFRTPRPLVSQTPPLSLFSPETSADTSSRPAPAPAPRENFPTHYDPLPAPAPLPSPSPLPQTLTASNPSSSNCPPCKTRRRPKRPSDKVPNIKPYKRRMSLNSLDNLRRG